MIAKYDKDTKVLSWDKDTIKLDNMPVLMHETKDHIVIAYDRLIRILNKSTKKFEEFEFPDPKDMQLVKLRSFHGSKADNIIFVVLIRKHYYCIIYSILNHSVQGISIDDILAGKLKFNRTKKGALKVNGLRIAAHKETLFLETSYFINDTTIGFFNNVSEKFEIYDLNKPKKLKHPTYNHTFLKANSTFKAGEFPGNYNFTKGFFKDLEFSSPSCIIASVPENL